MEVAEKINCHSDIDRHIGQISLWHRMVDVVSTSEITWHTYRYNIRCYIGSTSERLYQTDIKRHINLGFVYVEVRCTADQERSISFSRRNCIVPTSFSIGRYSIPFIEAISKLYFFILIFHLSRICICSWPISIWHWMIEVMYLENSIISMSYSFPCRALHRPGIVPTSNGWRRIDNGILPYRYRFDVGRHIGQT